MVTVSIAPFGTAGGAGDGGSGGSGSSDGVPAYPAGRNEQSRGKKGSQHF
ncbi:MAG: hypothetical protein J4F28_03630 [Nitrosopumilaceae archaeon]|nr:hypothetical protein [Nitrosopumilaceae archaeon]